MLSNAAAAMMHGGYAGLFNDTGGGSIGRSESEKERAKAVDTERAATEETARRETAFFDTAADAAAVGKHAVGEQSVGDHAVVITAVDQTAVEAAAAACVAHAAISLGACSGDMAATRNRACALVKLCKPQGGSTESGDDDVAGIAVERGSLRPPRRRARFVRAEGAAPGRRRLRRRDANVAGG